MYKSLSLCAIAALSASLMAQSSTTLPLGKDKVEGKSSRHIPLRYSPARIQNGYGPKATGWTTTKVIRELWARADQYAYLTTGFSVDMRVILSSKGADPKTASMVFAKNLGGDQKVFMKKKIYKFVAFSKGTTFPNKWSIQLKGDAPFVATTGNLVVDWSTYTDSKNTSQQHSNFYVDAVNISGKPVGTRGKYTSYGTGCNPTNFYNYSTGENVGESFRHYGYTRNMGDLVLSWLGAKKIAMAIPGLTGCTLYAPFTVFHPSVVKTTSTSGYANFVWGVVPAFMKGKMVWAQCAGMNAKGNLRFSRGNEITFGDYHMVYPQLVSHKYSYGFSTSRIFNPDKDDALYGWQGTATVFDVR